MTSDLEGRERRDEEGGVGGGREGSYQVGAGGGVSTYGLSGQSPSRGVYLVGGGTNPERGR